MFTYLQDENNKLLNEEEEKPFKTSCDALFYYYTLISLQYQWIFYQYILFEMCYIYKNINWTLPIGATYLLKIQPFKTEIFYIN